MKMRRSCAQVLKFALVVCLLLMVSTALAGTEMIEIVGKGEIDWENGVLRIAGYGAPPQGMSAAQAKLATQRAAKADAYRNALEVIEGVRLHSETKVKDFVLESDEIYTQVQGFIQGGQFVDVQYDRDGVCQVILVLPLAGPNGLTSFFENRVIQAMPKVPVVPQDKYVTPDQGQSGQGKTEESPAYTGVIIDARGLNIKPAVYSQIFDSDGYLVYGPTLLNVDQSGYTTMVVYSRSEEKALKLPRVGEKPLMIKAVSTVKGKNGEATDIVLNSKGAEAFVKADAKTGIIARAAVVYIID